MCGTTPSTANKEDVLKRWRCCCLIWYTHVDKMHHSFLTNGFKSCSLFHLVIFREAFNTSHKYLGWLLSLFFFQLCVRAASLPVHWLLLVKSSEQQLVPPRPSS